MCHNLTLQSTLTEYLYFVSLPSFLVIIRASSDVSGCGTVPSSACENIRPCLQLSNDGNSNSLPAVALELAVALSSPISMHTYRYTQCLCPRPALT